jgi:hypothetical protein
MEVDLAWVGVKKGSIWNGGGRWAFQTVEKGRGTVRPVGMKQSLHLETGS